MEFVDEFNNVFEKLLGLGLNKIASTILKKESKQYRKLLKTNNQLQKDYPLITFVVDNTNYQDTYSNDDIKALIQYYQNKVVLEDMERTQIYKVGYYAAIKTMYPIDNVLSKKSISKKKNNS